MRPLAGTLQPRHLVAGLLAAAIAVGAAAEPSEPAARGVRISYLANEGFLLESGGVKVLVDALFGDGLRGYPVVPPALRAEIEGARGRFAGVDLVLASHYHGDHFDAAAVARHLEANPGAVFLSTPQAVTRLRRELGPAAAGRELIAALPAEGETVRLELPGVTVDTLNLHHGRDRRPLVENLGLRIRIGGLLLLHVGDTEAGEADLRPYRAALEPVDVWLLPSWLLGEPPWQDARERAAGADRLIVMHLPAPDAPASWFGTAKSLDGYVADLREALPESWIPLTPLATRHYPAPGSRSSDG